jgi:hypothetical protein
MRSQRIPDCVSGDPVQFQQVVLDLVLGDYPVLWTLAELDRSLASSRCASSGEEPPRARVEDAVADLYAAGLVHRCGQFVFASRSAVEAERLAG